MKFCIDVHGTKRVWADNFADFVTFHLMTPIAQPVATFGILIH